MIFDDYTGKRVLVTGHTGFKGSWLTLWLKYLGADVMGFSLEPPTQPNMFEVIGLEADITHEHGDIKDGESVTNAFEKHQPQIVFHLAAQPIVTTSYEVPKDTFDTNVMGTVNILDAVRHTQSVRSVVCITSDKCYENQEWIWRYRENDPVGGHDPYSASKGCAEIVIQSYRKSFFTNNHEGETRRIGIASARAGNVIGGGDWAAYRLISDCVRSLSVRKTISIRNQSAIRPWQHVLDPLYGYLLLGQQLLKDPARYASSWNFGPASQDLWNVEQIVSSVCKLWGHGSFKISRNNGRHESQLLALDCSKAMSLLGWKPEYEISTALNKTIQWYRKFYSGTESVELKKFSLSQIKEYMTRKKSILSHRDQQKQGEKILQYV